MAKTYKPDDINSLEKRIKKLETDKQRYVSNIEAEIEKLEKRAGAWEAIQKNKARLELVPTLYDKPMERLQGELVAAQTEVAGRASAVTEQAQYELKSTLRKNWLRAGGTEEGFEEALPELLSESLKQAALEPVEEPRRSIRL